MNNANLDFMLAHQLFLKGQMSSDIMRKWEYKDSSGQRNCMGIHQAYPTHAQGPWQVLEKSFTRLWGIKYTASDRIFLKLFIS